MTARRWSSQRRIERGGFLKAKREGFPRPGSSPSSRLGMTLLLVEERVERFARVVGRQRFAFVGGEIAHDLRREHRAHVLLMLVRDARRDVLALATFPHRGRVEEPAVTARVQIGGAAEAGVVVRQFAEACADLTAL